MLQSMRQVTKGRFVSTHPRGSSERRLAGLRARVLSRERHSPSAEKGANGNYLFEIESQPGGPAGRSDTLTGSKPKRLIELPQDGRPLVLACKEVEVENG